MGSPISGVPQVQEIGPHYPCYSLSVSCCDYYSDKGNCYMMLVFKA